MNKRQRENAKEDREIYEKIKDRLDTPEDQWIRVKQGESLLEAVGVSLKTNKKD